MPHDAPWRARQQEPASPAADAAAPGDECPSVRCCAPRLRLRPRRRVRRRPRHGRDDGACGGRRPLRSRARRQAPSRARARRRRGRARPAARRGRSPHVHRCPRGLDVCGRRGRVDRRPHRLPGPCRAPARRYALRRRARRRELSRRRDRERRGRRRSRSRRWAARDREPGGRRRDRSVRRVRRGRRRRRRPATCGDGRLAHVRRSEDRALRRLSPDPHRPPSAPRRRHSHTPAPGVRSAGRHYSSSSRSTISGSAGEASGSSLAQWESAGWPAASSPAVSSRV